MLVLTSFLSLTHYAEGGATSTILIRADGTVDPSTAPLQRDENLYTLTGNAFGSIIVEKPYAIIDGAGLTLQGDGYGIGIDLTTAANHNVTITNLMIKEFYSGIEIAVSNDCTVIACTLQDNVYGIKVAYSNNATITKNLISNNQFGVFEDLHTGSNITQNTITNNSWGIYVGDPKKAQGQITNNTITSSDYGIDLSTTFGYQINHNTLTDNNYGIHIYNSENNTFTNNTIQQNHIGVYREHREDGTPYFGPNLFVHNTFADNIIQADSQTKETWDNGFAIGGNLWSDYTGEDFYANQYFFSDGKGDTPYTINQNNQDNHPLMPPHQANFHLHVKDQNNNPAVGISVRTTTLEARNGTTDQDGEVTFNNIQAGTYYLEVNTGQNWWSEQIPHKVPTNQTTTITITLPQEAPTMHSSSETSPAQPQQTPTNPTPPTATQTNSTTKTSQNPNPETPSSNSKPTMPNKTTFTLIVTVMILAIFAVTVFQRSTHIHTKSKAK